MPEYLAPGVYLEEVSFRAKSIEGVSTTTTAFIGPTRFGPTEGEPELITSYNQFERIYGGLDQLAFYAADDSGYSPTSPPTAMHNYLAQAVRAFFDNGGRRLYISRTYRSFADVNSARAAQVPPQSPLTLPSGLNADGHATALIPAPSAAIAGANEAAAAAATMASLALDAALDAANAAVSAAAAARTAAIQELQAAIQSIQDALPAPDASIAAIDLNTTNEADAMTTINAAVAGNVDAEAARDAAQPTIAAAIAARDTATAAEASATTAAADAAAEDPNVDSALADGIALTEGQPVPDLATANTNANSSANTADTRADEAEAALDVAEMAAQDAANAESALVAATPAERMTRATEAAGAAAAAATAAAAAVTAAVNARIAATNAARDGRFAELAADAAAVGVFRARYPGAAGNMTVTLTARAGQNILSNSADGPRVSQVQHQDLVLLSRTGSLYIAEASATGWTFSDGTTTLNLSDLDPATETVHRVLLSVEVLMPGAFSQPQFWPDLTVHAERRDSVLSVFAAELTSRAQALETPLVLESSAGPVELAEGLIGATALAELVGSLPQPPSAGEQTQYLLSGGNDGARPTSAEYIGEGGEDDPVKSGLIAFEDLEEISILAAPGLSFLQNGLSDAYLSELQAATQALISHCERMRYRVAVLDSPNNLAISEVRNYRAILDTTRAALYYPWIRIQDPITRAPIHVSPSGFITGIYARNDIEKGVHKAPANEVLLGAIGVETLLNKSQQDVLNPLGINAIRWFENRGIRVWGARTLSSDPEWKYLNIRRYFAYLEHSIERSTQWAVFEPNGEALWANVRRAVEDFLFNEWSSERLAGTKPAQAFFVRCDRSTMTQNDLDNGRMICLIGVAPLYPAEFVIFRIGQWTADRRG